MTVAVLFPGQGIQARGMGRDLFGRFGDLVQQADEILGYSVRELCTQDPDNRLSDTRYAQPAVYVVNALAYRKYLLDGGPRPDVLLGHSLGEYNALEAAGAVRFADGLSIVRERARMMSGVPGAMSAVMGLTAQRVAAVLAEHPESGTELSALNAPRQVVVAGPPGPDGLPSAVAALRAAGAVGASTLNVAGPFHSSRMASAAARFGAFLLGHRQLLAEGEIPVVSTRTARPHHAAVAIMIRDLAAQIDHPLLWQPAVQYLLDQDPHTEFHEVGSAVLGSLVGQIRRAWRATAAEAGAR